MLMITRRPGEKIFVGDDITIEVVEIRGDKVRLGITAPQDTQIHRQEVWVKLQEERREDPKTD